MKDFRSKEMVYSRLLFVVLVLVVLAKLFFTLSSPLSLFSEETQYWLWSKHLDWNYYSKPLMIAVYNRLGTLLLGDTEIGVRLSAWIFSSLAAWMVYKLSMYMFGKPKYAFLAAMMVLVMPFFHLASLFHTTDSSLVFFWILALYLIWRALEEEGTSLWVVAGIATALGILSKNVMVLIIPIVFLYLLITRPRILKQKVFYLFTAVSGLSLVPVVIWNFQHDFVTFRHLGTLGGVSGGGGFDWQAAFSYTGEYLGGQMAAVSLFFIPLLWLSIRRWQSHREQAVLFLLLPAVLIWMMFIGISLVKRVEINWPAFAYVSLPVAMAQVVSLYTSWKRYAWIAVGISGMLLAAIMYPAPLDAIGFKKVLKPQKDPFFRMAGYRELADRVDFLIDSLELERHFVFSDSYHVASELAFYMDGNPQTYNPNLGRRMNQFDLWPGLEQFEQQGFDGVFVRWGEGESPIVNNAFDSLIYQETRYGYLRGEPVLTFQIQVHTGFQKMQEVDTGAY
ncbi:MAG: glycosyltransferase family 39 protein [Lunatimonas sp.]|uniref:ArnT family glycosyltransferase n=1 Tax=Lunatimonas sp. TaxID=2060141 RepID=UPI00263B8A4D|nr:glycosyltransferase family 39 protein [Lunatimonas sp.]MCC5939805.1 glycosyltransferase family 39 protein [Lunatimonas sp.]